MRDPLTGGRRGVHARRITVCTVIADDVTGACDAAVQFADLGFSTAVALDLASIEECDTEVIAASSNTREDHSDGAAAKVQRFAAALGLRRSPLRFKKIDSTLRGNLASEIEACMKAFECRVGIIAPAFPEMGRIISGGWLKTGLPDASMSVHLPTLLAEQGLTALTHIDHSCCPSETEKFQRRMGAECARGIRYFVFDTISASDLQAVAKAAGGLRQDLLWVGSAGLARVLAQCLVERSGCPLKEGRHGIRPSETGGPILLWIGSDHPVTLEQLKVLAASRPVEMLRADRGDLPRARAALQNGRNLCFRVEPGKTGEGSVRSVFAGLQGAPIQGLVISGGATASLVCSALGARSIRLEGEIVLGIPWGRLAGGLADGLPVATKSGGFGSSDALAETVDFLSRCPKALEIGTSL